MEKIAINQLGYRVGQRKLATVTGEYDSFVIREKESKNIVIQGKILEERYDIDSQQNVKLADFSSLNTAGEYIFCVGEEDKGIEFSVGEDIYKDVFRKMLDVLYLQRCGCAISKEKFGKWGHTACHKGEATFLVQGKTGKKDVTGGWHDAGDYGRYTVPIAATITQLIFTYNLLEEKESFLLGDRNELKATLLDEIEYGVRWLLKVQDESGAFYQKVTPGNYPELDVMPEQDESILYICPVTTQATAVSVAVLIQSANIFKDRNQQLSDACKDAAYMGWSYLEERKQSLYYKNPDLVKTESYVTENDLNSRFWALCELYNMSGDEVYHAQIKEMLKTKKFDLTGFGWRDVGGYGSYSYLTSSRERDVEVENYIRESLLKRAQYLVEQCKKSGYEISMKHDDYVWGSNSNLLDYAICLMVAGRFSNDKIYDVYAQEHINYLFGKNPLSISYVTGFGTNKIRHPHHRICMKYGPEDPIEGFVIGGPNIINQDPYLKELTKGRPASKSFIDDSRCFSANEMTTYWNTMALILIMYYGS